MPERRVTAEVGKAETALRRLDRAWDEGRKKTDERWSRKRFALIRSWPPEVRETLVKLRVLFAEDLAEAGLAETGPAHD